MDCYQYVEIIIQAVMCLGTIISIIFGILSHRSQQRAAFYEQYTERYAHIMEIMPEEFFTTDEYKDLESHIQKQITHCLRLYVDLCSEEIHHKKLGRISSEDWNEVAEGMEYMFTKESILNLLDSNHLLDGYHDVRTFIDSLRKNK